MPLTEKRFYKNRAPYKVDWEVGYTLTQIYETYSSINLASSNLKLKHRNIGACSFHPTCSSIIATCFANIICFIDTNQERIAQKYTHLESEEQFFTLAWTRLTRADIDQHDIHTEDCCVLAAAGKLGSIKLLNPLQNECYRYLFGHMRGIVALKFSKIRQDWLFSASSDRTIRLWNIGDPWDKNDLGVCIAKFDGFSSCPSSLSISPTNAFLLAGCEDGTMLRYSLEQIHAQSPSENEKFFDAETSFSPDMIYPSGMEWHESCVDDLWCCENEFVVSRATSDLEIIIWNSNTSTSTDADIRCALDWPETWTSYMKFTIFENQKELVVIAGDDKGAIHIYNIPHDHQSKTLPDLSKEKFEPDMVLKHPQSDAIIYDICISKDLSMIIAIDSVGRVFVWKAK